MQRLPTAATSERALSKLWADMFSACACYDPCCWVPDATTLLQGNVQLNVAIEKLGFRIYHWRPALQALLALFLLLCGCRNGAT